MVGIYTHEIFEMFQDELEHSYYHCTAHKVKEEGATISFFVKDFSLGKECLVDREVTYNDFNQEADCSCKLFECYGLLCRHILIVLKQSLINELPEYYIVNRWTRKATSIPIFDADGIELANSAKLVSIINQVKLSEIWAKCLHIAACSNEAYLLAEDRMNVLLADLIHISKNTTDKVEVTRVNNGSDGASSNANIKIYPPSIAKTKRSGKRLEGGKEKSMEQHEKWARLCKACGERGYHNSRNCPSLRDTN